MEMRYAVKADLDWLIQHDVHIRPAVCEAAIEAGHVLVLLISGRLAGWLRYNLFWDEIPFMNLLYLLPQYRGKGYGAQLVAFWETSMKSQGYDRVMTSTQANESAQHFYRKQGYQDAGGFFPFCEDLELVLTKRLS